MGRAQWPALPDVLERGAEGFGAMTYAELIRENGDLRAANADFRTRLAASEAKAKELRGIVRQASAIIVSQLPDKRDHELPLLMLCAKIVNLVYWTEEAKKEQERKREEAEAQAKAVSLRCEAQLRAELAAEAAEKERDFLLAELLKRNRAFDGDVADQGR